MKAILFFLVTATAFSASALESHYGRVSNKGFKYSCTFYNNTNHSLDMKYVVFDTVPVTGDSHGQPVQERIDRVVRSGEYIKASTMINPHYNVHTCKFLAR